ncbi:MAG: hypothetical protein V4567_11340 [Pseudomonadota bacterium]
MVIAFIPERRFAELCRAVPATDLMDITSAIHRLVSTTAASIETLYFSLR